MRMIRNERGDVTVAKLGGVIGWDDTDSLKHLSDELAEAGKTALVLEMSGVSRVSSSFIGWLFAASDEDDAGTVIASPSAVMIEILEVTGLDKSVPVFAAVDEAVASFG